MEKMVNKEESKITKCILVVFGEDKKTDVTKLVSNTLNKYKEKYNDNLIIVDAQDIKEETKKGSKNIHLTLSNRILEKCNSESKKEQNPLPKKAKGKFSKKQDAKSEKENEQIKIVFIGHAHPDQMLALSQKDMLKTIEVLNKKLGDQLATIKYFGCNTGLNFYGKEFNVCSVFENDEDIERDPYRNTKSIARVTSEQFPNLKIVGSTGSLGYNLESGKLEAYQHESCLSDYKGATRTFDGVKYKDVIQERPFRKYIGGQLQK